MIFTKFIVNKKVAKAKTRQRYTRSKHVVIQIQANQREQVSKCKQTQTFVVHSFNSIEKTIDHK